MSEIGHPLDCYFMVRLNTITFVFLQDVVGQRLEKLHLSTLSRADEVIYDFSQKAVVTIMLF